jgi:hypothetical protein
MTFKLFIALSGFGGAIFVLLLICLRGVCYISQDKIEIVEKSGRQDLGALPLELRQSWESWPALTCGSCLPFTRGQQGASSIRPDITPRVQPGNHQRRLEFKTMNTEESNGESKFAVVPIAQRTQQIASVLWQQRPVRYLVVPGIVIALGVGAWAHLRPKTTNMESQPSPESES